MLAELLDAVAIIGVLVAISIAFFTSQLEKSREAVSVENMRVTYAQVQTCMLAGSEGQTEVTFTPKATGDKVAGTYATACAIKSQKNNGWSGLAAELPFTAPTDPDATKATSTFTVDADGKISRDPTLG